MEPVTKDLGKIMMTMEGEHSLEREYEVLSVVSFEDISYISKKNVPSNIPVTNTEYWQFFGSLGNTPKLRKNIETEYIEVSYDNGEHWKQLITLSEITGPQGIQGPKGEPAVAIEDYITVEATLETIDVTDVLPSIGSADTVYRVSNWDGIQYNETTYSEYGWYSNTYKKLATRQIGIDDEPIVDSQNLVKSGGVATKISQLGQYVNNPEWTTVVTDANNRILYGVKTDGKFYFGNGCPPQVQEYVLAHKAEIENALATKVDKITGKSLIDADFASSQETINNSEWLQVIIDSENKVLEGIDKSGNKVQNLPIKTPLNKISYIDNPEWLEVITDAEGRIIEGTKKDGTKLYFGVPDDIKNYIKNYIGDKFINRTAYQIHLASMLGFARRSTWDSEHDYLPVDWIAPLVFMHISDAHIGGTTYRPQIYNAVKALNKLSVNDKNNGMNVKFMLVTGDICNNNYAEDISNFTQAVADANKPVLIAIGNHDVGNSMIKSICGTDAQVYTKFISSYIDGWDLNTENEGIPHPTDKCYYFKDFADEKIRLIVLYEYESDFELDPNDSSKLKYKRGYRAFRQAQIDWLIDSLMKTPDDYGVIIAKHQQENQRGYLENLFNSVLTYGGGDQFTYVDKDIIAEIVDAFINKTPLMKDYVQTGEVVTTLSVDVDFSVKNNTEFICYVSGHNHCDGISFLKDFPNQLELNIGCDNTHYTHGSDMLQQKDTLSEDLINVYSIDRNNKCICVVRIGADMSCMAQHRVCEKISYII